jgi:hypothetical protein
MGTLSKVDMPELLQQMVKKRIKKPKQGCVPAKLYLQNLRIG